jgi:phage/plasmid-associated DNA primase
MILHGGHNCGKSALLTVFHALFGGAISIPFKQLEKHGLTPFQQRLPWILHEAFDQTTWHVSDVVKTLITGEQVTADIKCGPHVPVKYDGPAFWATNHDPKFKENTEAMISRIMPIPCKAGFDDENLAGVAKWARAEGFAGPGQMVAAKEIEGVLAWAIEGLRAARQRGAITISDKSIEAKKEIWRQANVVEAFIEDCCDINPTYRILHADFCIALVSWFAVNCGDGSVKAPNNKQIGKYIGSLHRKNIQSKRLGKGITWVLGVWLNDEGMKHFEHGRTARAYENRNVDVSTGNPNRIMNAELVDLSLVVGDMKGDMKGDMSEKGDMKGDIEDTF